MKAVIERDANGVPVRLRIGTVKISRFLRPVYVTCPRCASSRRLVAGRCLNCWCNTAELPAQIIESEEDVFTS